MKISRPWLQRFFEKPLPPIEELAEALTFHAFEIEEIDTSTSLSAGGETMEVKVLPDRAGYALSHRGVAYELSAILKLPLKSDLLREPIPEWPTTDKLVIKTDKDYVLRHTGALVQGVKVGPSPAWLVEALEAVGQRSINNIVDASNFVMLNMGQPTHAFDADKITWDGEVLKIDIRAAKEGEEVTILSGEKHTLGKDMYVIADGTKGVALDIAGIKGGLESGVTENTENIFISSGNYDGTLLRRTSQSLKIFTDAVSRFQNRPSPELTAYGMRDLVRLVKDVAGGELVGVIDEYAQKPVKKSVTLPLKKVENILGAEYPENVVEDVLQRLDLSFEKKGTSFVINPPFERTDLTIPEDVVEEVGRIVGYEHVEPKGLSSEGDVPFTDHRKRIEALRQLLVSAGFNEVSTYTMLDEGDMELSKPLAEDKKYLRAHMAAPHKKAIELNQHNLPIFNAPDLRLFEVGHVWPKGEEKFVVGITYFTHAKGAEKKRDEVFASLKEEIKKLLGKVPEGVVTGNTIEFDMHELTAIDIVPDFTMPKEKLVSYTQFSQYPFVLRDIAVWVPESVSGEEVENLIQEKAGGSLLRIDSFDTFTKGGRTSHAFHLVFQSHDRTLSDEEVGKWMDGITSTLTSKSWEVR